jgi:hypothetical protein
VSEIEPGIHQMTADTYHQDPCPAPSLSSSIARTLLGYSPLHAFTEHPRLSPTLEREEKEIFDLGSAAHSYLLEGETGFVIVDAKDWRTKDAQSQRDAARLEGKIPLLAKHWEDIQAMAEAARRQLGEHEATPIPFAGGKPEQTLIWREGEIWCRARLDWLHDDHSAIDDLKTTSASANPDAWSRLLFNSGYDVQAAFYLRGLRAISGGGARGTAFRFICQENFKPFALSVIGLAPDALELADRKVKRAIALWSACLETGRWPGYPTQVCYAELPPWEEARLMERELREEGIRDDGRPIGEQLAGMGGTA